MIDPTEISAPQGAREAVPEVRYAVRRGMHLAYQSFGEGDLELVLSPGFVSHLEFAWQHPPYRRFMERLGSFARVTVYDKRGSGLSDPLDSSADFDQHLSDLAAVIDAAGATKPVVLGWSEGAAVAALFAAHHPEALESLVLYGAFPKLLAAPDYPEGVPEEDFGQFLDGLEKDWGKGSSLNLLAAEKVDDEAFCRWWGQYERASASPGLAVSALRINAALDMLDILPTIHVPTLLIHRTEDAGVPVEGSRLMAERMPNARLVELPGTLHWPWIGGTDEVVEEVEEFLTGARRPAEPNRALATVLFTDIVHSTETAAELGDMDWRNLLEDHDEVVRQKIEEHCGKLIKSTGDGLLATFDRPAMSVRCAQALHEALSRHGIEIRAGLHTGEIELIGDDVGGLGVHIAARVSALAGTGQTLVSRTVTDLVIGSGIEFEKTGTEELKGIPGEWELFAVRD